MDGDGRVARPGWRILPDPAAVAGEALRLIQESAERCLSERGVFLLVLAGGTTPLEVYRRLASCSADTQGWHLFFGDERCVPPDHRDRNSRAVREAWLDAAAFPESRIHEIPAELGSEEGATRYAREISAWQPFDLVLLGMGEDGHVASLFPWQRHPEEDLVVAVENAPKPPSGRVSLNYRPICNARERLLLVTGAGKRAAIRAWEGGDVLPVARVEACGPLTVLLDSATMPGEPHRPHAH